MAQALDSAILSPSQAACDPSKELRLLLAFFGEAELPLCHPVDATRMPRPYRDLLVHSEHMTVTLEEHHESKVNVKPYKVHRQGDLYGRKLDLLSDATGKVVMTGIMLFNFTFCNDKVKELIVSEQVPLGRILIENNILREISTHAFLKLDGRDPLVRRFGQPEDQPAYGRLATIFCDHKPAVDLVEIVNPDS